MNHTENDYGRALAWTLTHAFLFSLTGVFIKLTSPDVSVLDLVFYHGLFTLLVLTLFVRISLRQCFTREALPLLLSRGLFGFGGATATFYAMSELPLAIAMMLTLTTPVFVMLLGHFTIGERITLAHLVPVALTLAGLALVLDLDLAGGIEAGLPLVPALVGLLGSLLAALAFVSMRKALALVNTGVVVFWFALCSAIGAGGFSLGSFAIPNGSDVLFVAAICAVGLLSDYTKTTAYKYAVAWYVSLVSLVSVIFAAGWDWSLFAERLVFMQLIGIAIAVAGIALTVLRGRAA